MADNRAASSSSLRAPPSYSSNCIQMSESRSQGGEHALVGQGSSLASTDANKEDEEEDEDARKDGTRDSGAVSGAAVEWLSIGEHVQKHEEARTLQSTRQTDKEL